MLQCIFQAASMKKYLTLSITIISSSAVDTVTWSRSTCQAVKGSLRTCIIICILCVLWAVISRRTLYRGGSISTAVKTCWAVQTCCLTTCIVVCSWQTWLCQGWTRWAVETRRTDTPIGGVRSFCWGPLKTEVTSITLACYCILVPKCTVMASSAQSTFRLWG